MRKTKVLSLVLAGVMLLSISGASVAGGVAEVRETRKTKEKILTEITSTVRDRTQEHVGKVSSLVRAAVQIARAEEEAQKAAEAAAAEAKAKQEAKEAEEKVRKEKAEAEERAKKEAEEARKKAAGEDETSATADATDPYIVAEPVYYAQDYSYSYADAYYAPAYDALYADSVSYYADPYAAEAVSYTEPQYSYDTLETSVYDAVPDVIVDTTAETVYADDVYADDPLTTGYDEAAYYEETAYYEEPVYTDDIYADAYDDSYSVGDGGVRATASDSDLDLLASIIYCEAGGESYEGQVAVGAVVLNRMESSLYPDDMNDVIYQSGQFTPAMTGWLDQVRASGVPDYCYDAAQAALNGENPVGDCLYFHAGGGDGLTIGNQTFY